MKVFCCLITVIFVSDIGICTGSREEEKKTQRRYLLSQPPEESKYDKYKGQCGVANFCSKQTDIGCIGNDYIWGGMPALWYQYPWIVALDITLDSGVRFVCTGSLISTRHVLTAKHCFKNVAGIGETSYGVRVKPGAKKVFALLGAARRNNEALNFAYKAKQEVVEIKIPPDTVTTHDMALLRIRDVEFNEYIRPICLPFDGIIRDSNYTFAGFGLSVEDGVIKEYENALQVITGVQVMEINKYSLESTKHTTDTWAHNGTRIRPDFRVQFTVDQAGCGGDSGAPLMWHNQITGRYFLTGVFYGSAGDDCNSNKQPTSTFNYAFFTKVTYFLDYIYREMNPDGYANGLCRPADCFEPNATYVAKDGVLNAPCDYIRDQSIPNSLNVFCLAGEPGRVLENRYNKDNRIRPNEWVDRGFKQCVKCPNRKINWNYQQWINEITLGSFKQPRYYGEQSPYDAFDASYFKGWNREEQPFPEY